MAAPPVTNDVQEIEWQFDALDLRPVLRWLNMAERQPDGPAVEVVANGNGVTQVDRYLETDDWRFQRAGYALRIRRLGRRRDAVATLKGLEPASADTPGLRSRRELSERLGAADLQTLFGASGPVAARVRAVVGKKRLLPLFEVRTRRRAFFLKIEGLPPGGDRARRDRDQPERRGVSGPTPASRDRGPARNAAGRSNRSFASFATRVRCSPPA